MPYSAFEMMPFAGVKISKEFAIIARNHKAEQ
jgi:hypothetical protein